MARERELAERFVRVDRLRWESVFGLPQRGAMK
jgi:hypothetical protein